MPEDALEIIRNEICRSERKERDWTLERDFTNRLIDTAQAIILVLDSEGRIERINPHLEKILGYRMEEVRGKDWFETFLPRANLEWGRGVFRQAMAGIRVQGIVGPIVTREGREVLVEWHDKVIEDPEGNAKGFLAVGHDITKRSEAEKALVRYQARLRRLASELTLAEENERWRIAEGMHEDVAQQIVGAMLILEVTLSERESGRWTGVQDAINVLKGLLDKVKSLTYELSLPSLHVLGLEAALETQVKLSTRRSGTSCTFEDDGLGKPIGKDTRSLLFRAVRELLANVVKHARAEKAVVSAKRVESEIQVSVMDNGSGFDVGILEDKLLNSHSFGLFSVRERMRQLGGKFLIDSVPGEGTTVTLTAPLE
ncbi:MAG: PAS domain-containing sensor histidine kinase [Planctomycetota bacterium]